MADVVHLIREYVTNYGESDPEAWCEDVDVFANGTRDIAYCTCAPCLRAVLRFGVAANGRLNAILFPPKPIPPDPGDVEVASWRPA